MSPHSKLEVTPGFVLLAAWFALVNGGQTLAFVVSAACIHEFGHWLVLRILGAPAYAFRLSALGAELAIDSGRLSYAGELAAVLAGPGANLLAVLVLAALGRWPAFTGANLVLAAFNLLPIRPLDGGRAVWLLAAWLAGPPAGDFVLRALSGLASGTLAALLAWVMLRTGGSLWLLPAFFGALCAALSEFHPPRRYKKRAAN